MQIYCGCTVGANYLVGTEGLYWGGWGGYTVYKEDFVTRMELIEIL